MLTRAIGRVCTHGALLLGAAIVLTPFVWMVSTSLKPADEVYLPELRLLPETWHAAENYGEAFREMPLLRFMLNGVVVTVSIFLIQIAVAVPCAYALAKLRFPGRGLLFALVMLCLVIPPHAISIPLYLMFFHLGILNSYAALVVPWTISVFGIFLMRQFFRTVPDELLDAARVDGMTEFGIVWRVMVPTALPALTAFGIFSVVSHWNDYFWPLVAVNSEHLFTPPLGIARFRTEEFGIDYGPLMAAATVTIAPLVIAFLIAQRRFVEGIAFTGLR
ncbi:MAG: carbohydrate ABC transporter permease [Pseudomonadota bacterium]